MGAGDSALIVAYSITAAADATSYTAYCATMDGKTIGAGGGTSSSAAASATGAGGADGGTTSSVASSSHASSAVASSSATLGAAVGTVAVAGVGSVGTGAALNAGGGPCSSPVLTPGTIGNPAYQVPGVTANGAELNITGLKNGTEYACAIAATDTLGNAGPLSSVYCDTPYPTNDFFGLYRADGGLAGGGLCSFGREPSPLTAIAGMTGLALAAFVLRRRSRGRS
jgi:hypothetical protein